jgi:hypothetical protein
MNFPSNGDVYEILLIAGVIGIAGLALMIATRRLRAGHEINLRPLQAIKALDEQIAQTVESATQIHVSLGRASLVDTASPTSVAGASVLDRVAKEAGASGLPPIATVGDGTVLLLAQQRQKRALRLARRTEEYSPALAQFIAASTDRFAYAAGVTSVVLQDGVATNILVGRYGPELAIMADAAERENLVQIIGTDDPTALAIGTALTENLLVGEELFAARAYLEGKASQLASVQVQDALRLLAAVAILGLAIYQFAVS